MTSSPLEFRPLPCPVVAPQPLAPLAEAVAAKLTARGETVTVFDATAGGLVFASLLAVPGASKYATCAGNHISTRRSRQVLGDALVGQLANKAHDADTYKASKRAAVTAVARQMRDAVGATWCIAESGACGPTFSFPGIERGFTALCVSGPVERAAFVESANSEREPNMWGFAKAALNLLEECLDEAGSLPASQCGAKRQRTAPIFEGREDRFGGVTVELLADSVATADDFAVELRRALAGWREGGKRGLWFTVPLSCSRFVPALASEGFEYHHSKPGVAVLTLWVPIGESKLPRYGFTQIGVGGVTVNSKDEVLMVQERLTDQARFEGMWKLPGGLADPGEDFAVTAGREVQEETGVPTELVGLVSIRHNHGARFGQGDLYCVVKLRALSDEITLDPSEISDAQWMSLGKIASLVPAEPGASLRGCVSTTTHKVIELALKGPLVKGAPVPTTRGGTSMMYCASD